LSKDGWALGFFDLKKNRETAHHRS
jgi:hypothetical protein